MTSAAPANATTHRKVTTAPDSPLGRVIARAEGRRTALHEGAKAATAGFNSFVDPR